jgi:hypothetical protein
MTRHDMRNSLLAAVAFLLVFQAAGAAGPPSDRATIRGQLGSQPIVTRAQAAAIGRDIAARVLAGLPALVEAARPQSLQLAATRPGQGGRS